MVSVFFLLDIWIRSSGYIRLQRKNITTVYFYAHIIIMFIMLFVNIIFIDIYIYFRIKICFLNV